MKTLTNIRNTENYLKSIILISLLVFQVSLKASEVPSSTEEAFETEQAVEEWMLNLSTWAKEVDYYASNESSESETKIERWMIDPNHEVWGYEEEEQEIEEWMYNVNNCNWNGCADEEEIEIENWMVDITDWIQHNDLLTEAF